MAKTISLLGSFFTLFFTSVLAPVLIHHIDETCVAKPQKAPRYPDEERVVVQGTGATPEAAWYDALGKALRTVVTPMVDARTWTQENTFIWGIVQRNAGRLITRCQDMGYTQDRGTWRREVVVYVARAELAAQFRAAHVRVISE